jgi:hypothetical protein
VGVFGLRIYKNGQQINNSAFRAQANFTNHLKFFLDIRQLLKYIWANNF